MRQEVQHVVNREPWAGDHGLASQHSRIARDPGKEVSVGHTASVSSAVYRFAQAMRSSTRRSIVYSTGTKPCPSQNGAPLKFPLAKCSPHVSKP